MTEHQREDAAPREHPSADHKRMFRVGYFVSVDVEAFDAGEAGLVGEAALGWPGDWRPRHDPVPVEGVLNGYIVRASIVRSQALQVSDSGGSNAPGGAS